MKYLTLVLIFAAGAALADNGGGWGPPDVARIVGSTASLPHAPAKSSTPPKAVLPPR
jgi:hypothetical protein